MSFNKDTVGDSLYVNEITEQNKRLRESLDVATKALEDTILNLRCIANHAGETRALGNFSEVRSYATVHYLIAQDELEKIKRG